MKFKKLLKFLLIFLIITGWIFSGFPQIFNFPPEIQLAQATALTLYETNTAATTLATANQLTNSAPASEVSTITIKVGTATGWDTLPSQGSTSNWAKGTSEPAQLGTGFLWDVTTLEGQQILAGNWTPKVKLEVSNGSVVADIHVRTSLRTSGGVYTTIADAVSTGQTISATPAVFSITATTTASATNFNAGDKLYQDVILNITTNSTGKATATFTEYENGGANESVATPGYQVQPATFLGNDTDPGVNPTIAPGAATTTVDTFNLKTNTGTDTVTGATATLATGTGTSTVAVLITNSGNTTTYCTTYTPSGDSVSLTGCNLPVTTASTTFNLRITPLSHAAMPPPPGGTYHVTALITSVTTTNTNSGSDTTSDTVTIDNQSPNGATAVSGTAGDAKVTLNWTASNSSDFSTTNGSVILRWASATAGSEVPAEGNSSYSAGNTIGTATVACVISSAASASLSKIDGTGGDVGCTTSALTNGQAYTYKAFQRDTSGNYDVGVSIGTFTPAAAASLTFTIDTNSVSFVSTLTPGTPVSTSSVLTVNTNNAAGYNITINRASTTPTLILSADNSTTISDNPNSNNWTAPGTGTATTTVGPSAVWTSGATQGLGFRVKQTGTTSGAYHLVWWGTDDTGANALYSGISTSTAAQVFSRNNVGTASNENITVEYKLDTAANQKSGKYVSSPVVYTATAN